MSKLFIFKTIPLILLFWPSSATGHPYDDLLLLPSSQAPSQLDKPILNPNIEHQLTSEENSDNYPSGWSKVKEDDDDSTEMSRLFSEESMGKRNDLIMKRSMAMGRTSLRPGKRSVQFDPTFRYSKRSVAVGRAFFRPGKRSDVSEEYDDTGMRGKRTVAVGRVSFRPGKRSTAIGRWNFRPGKRSAAVGRIFFRPGKRFDIGLN
ncbi:unnamed protein product [Auanema sp. JU1783]|nr:unnamed protein product [Auanema sp. JU1783]